jgi:hypothetical protein
MMVTYRIAIKVGVGLVGAPEAAGCLGQCDIVRATDIATTVVVESGQRPIALKIRDELLSPLETMICVRSAEQDHDSGSDVHCC